MDLFAKCGNNCGRCALYKGNLRDDTRSAAAAGMARYINWNPKPENLQPCAGCQATEGYLYIRNCAVRLCAQYNDLEDCAYCAVFPCRDVPTVSVPEDYRDTVEARLGEPVPEPDYLVFIEPYEGIKHLEAIRSLLDRGQLVEPAPVTPLRTRVAAFPDLLETLPESQGAFRSLYDLLIAILTGRAEPYVRQIRLHQRRKELLNLLWVFGRYGQPSEDGAGLVIDGRVHGARKAFSNVVRKRDNSLHTSTRTAVQLLGDFGVTIEHLPLTRKAWLLEMALDDQAGGQEVLTALCDYVGALIEAHGEPKYAGSSRYRGEAYYRFSRADMTDLARP
jgi:hypothetical protein